MDNNPWGLSGPEFIWLYVGGFVFACVATLVLRRRVRSARTATQPEPLTVDETAYLAGGWPRLVEATLADLVDRNVIRVQRNGLLYPVSDSGFVPESELEDSLVSRITKRPGRPLHYHLATLSNLSVYDEIRYDLVRRGLLFDGGTRGQVALAALPLILLAVIGIARWINGVNLGFPVGYLSVLLILTFVAILFALRPVKVGPTSTGRRMLAGPAGQQEDAAAAVARHGMRAYPDMTISALFRESRVRSKSYDSGSAVTVGTATGFAWGGGGSSCSSGGSSSSGSSCGGGGGGCGGGGS